MIIWGTDTGVRVEVSFLQLREPKFNASEVTINETQRVQFANGPGYVKFITDELPRQLTFLSLFAIGQSFYGRQEYQNAVMIVEKAIVQLEGMKSLPKGSAEAYFRLGWLYHEVGVESNRVQAQFDATISLNPYNDNAYINRGNARQDQGDIDGAIDDYNQAIYINPMKASAYLNRGNAWVNKGDLSKAIKDYSQAILIDDKDFRNYNNRANAYAAQGDWSRAVRDYDQAIDIEPRIAQIYNQRASAYRAQGDIDRAIQDYDRALYIDPESIYAYNNRGLAYKDQGNIFKAIRDFDQAIALRSDFAAFYTNRGIAHLAQENYDAAIADYRHARELSQSGEWAYDIATQYLSELGVTP